MDLETKDPAIDGIAQAARALGFINETAFRNLCFKCEFERLAIDRNVEEVLQDMSDRYCLSFEQMKIICYRTSEVKKFTTTEGQPERRNKKIIHVRKKRRE